MHALYACVAHQHDLHLVLLAAAVCVAGVYATFSLGTYAWFSRQPAARRLWACACVIACASGTWATHFVAMLAFHPGAPMGFQPVLSATSFLVAILGIGLGVVGVVYARTPVGRAGGGAVVGLGVAAMHYTGMAAYEVAGTISWNIAAVAASVVTSVGFAAAGALVVFSPRRLVRALAPVALLLCICSLHFVGMTALTVVYDPSRPLPADAVEPRTLAVAVAAAAIGVIALAAAGAALDRAARRRRRQERQRMADLADIALEGLMICEGDVLLSANHSLRRLPGMGGDLAQRSLSELLGGLPAEAISLEEEQDAWLTPPGVERIPVRVQRRGVEINRRPHHVIAVRDQRERLRTEAQIRDLAFCDPLTGLPNRARFALDLEAQAGSRRARERGLAVMMIDLDRFKLVNDTLGHGAGDKLLARAAGRLQAAVRDGDTVARLGGDEFAVLQAGVTEPEQTRVLAARIVDLLGRPFLIDGRMINVGASVGVALAPSDGDTPEDLMRNADLALYRAKSDGRGSFRLFETGLDAQMQARRALEIDLRRALARQDFELAYQPLIDARTRRITGAEALIRWRHPQRGLISPLEFIPVAEETGLIGAIGQWVLRTACAEAASWPEPLTIAVNLSPAQFRDPALCAMVAGVLAETGLAPQRLELEITEGVLIADEARVLAALTELRRMGARISLDDFGTGYSSLSYLARFPVDKLKVDRSFISQCPANVESAAIVRAILSMSACLGLATTVEGIETAEQLAFSAGEGCDQLQGYLLSRPLSASDLSHFMDAARRAA